MKKKMIAVAIGAVFSASTAFAGDTLTTDQDKISYSIGADLGKNFKRQNISINPTALAAGIKDSMSGKLQMSDDQMKEALEKFQKDLMAKRADDFKRVAEENKKNGQQFLMENKEKPGVVTLASGLQYKIIKEGNGKKPTKNDSVSVEYTGKLINGEVFDSTQKAGKPATFKLSQVIPGWTEVLQLMPVGSEWEVFIPSDLAYGARSVGGPIGPNETLIFNIKLLSVN